MKKLLILTSMLWSVWANAQFTPGQVLTAAELNNQFALYAQLTGATFVGPISASSLTGTPISGSTGSFTSLTATGTVSLPAGSVLLSELATQATNTILANATGSTASPTAVAIPSCSTTSSALLWTTSSGFSCNTTINASTLGGVAAASYAPLASPTFTGTPAAPTASATTNTTQIATTAMVNSAVTGGSLAGSFTTLASSGTYTPSQTNGIVGTTTNNNVNAGSVGEYVTNSSNAVSATSGVITNCASVSLTAGDWDVTGIAQTNPAATTTTTAFIVGVSPTSATFGTVATGVNNYVDYNSVATPANSAINLAPMVTRMSLATTTTVYLVCEAVFATSTLTVSGFIRARRVR